MVLDARGGGKHSAVRAELIQRINMRGFFCYLDSSWSSCPEKGTSLIKEDTQHISYNNMAVGDNIYSVSKDIKMETSSWDRLLLSADLPVRDLGSLAVDDIDKDSQIELFVGGEGGLWWFRPATFERGLIDEGHFGVGLVLADLDGDGNLELASARWGGGETPWTIVWYKPEGDLSLPWGRFTIERACNGHAHDLVLADIDADGILELIANACYCEMPGLYIYKPRTDPKEPWSRTTVIEGIFSEGVAISDLDGDGCLEIIHGADWFKQPKDGPFEGPWQRQVYAGNFREMCRVAVVDITGNDRDDIIITDSEYKDGYLSWFENRLAENPSEPWIEHRLDQPLNFSHSLDVHRDPETGAVLIYLAEMAAGGWDQPYNWDARHIQYRTADRGKSWQRTEIIRGQGTHQAVLYDIDGDGELEIVGKEWGNARQIPKVHIWKKMPKPSPLGSFRHRFLDRDKPYTATDILTVDIDGDGCHDVVCGAWWYKINNQVRHTIPDVYQIHTAYDLDGDGRDELIATKRAENPTDWYNGLTSEFVWLKPVDPINGEWEMHPIGTGTGDWPHGAVVAPVLPDKKLALLVGYHSAHADPSRPDYPEIFTVPTDPRSSPWELRILAEIPYGEEILPWDITGNGVIDIVAGAWWLENLGNGCFSPHQMIDGFYPARLGVSDINGNGKADIILGEEVLDFENRVTPWSRVVWLEHPTDPRTDPWQIHTVDKVRCAHSISVADLDGDGQSEIILGEHDPFEPYRSRCRVMAYKKANPEATSWYQYTIDDRFEHHDGTKIIQLPTGKIGIVSHGWQDNKYVHLWEPS
jgi:hypothetical protein